MIRFGNDQSCCINDNTTYLVKIFEGFHLFCRFGNSSVEKLALLMHKQKQLFVRSRNLKVRRWSCEIDPEYDSSLYI